MSEIYCKVEIDTGRLCCR